LPMIYSMPYKNTCMHNLSHLFMLMVETISKGAINESEWLD
jgi:hypothetical protein